MRIQTFNTDLSTYGYYVTCFDIKTFEYEDFDKICLLLEILVDGYLTIDFI